MGRNGVLQPVSGVPPPEIAVPPPKVVALPPGDLPFSHHNKVFVICDKFWSVNFGKIITILLPPEVGF